MRSWVGSRKARALSRKVQLIEGRTRRRGVGKVAEEGAVVFGVIPAEREGAISQRNAKVQKVRCRDVKECYNGVGVRKGAGPVTLVAMRRACS